VKVALLPKAKAEDEGSLRPIGLLPYVYRVWMVLRKQHTRSWVTHMHGGKSRGATDLALELRIRQEASEHQGHTMLAVFLDCSKCYERVRHDSAAERAVRAGAPAPIIRLAFDMYTAERRLSVHGAIGRPVQVRNGLVAGCAFAVHILKAYLGPLRETGEAEVRDYVDDVMLFAATPTPAEAAEKLSDTLAAVREWMGSQSMVLNPNKEQLYAPTAAGRRAWAEREPDYQGTVTAVATDLGTTQRTRIRVGDNKVRRLAKAEKLAARIDTLPLQRHQKARLAEALLLQGALYGTELDPLTAQQVIALRGAIAAAVWGRQTGRNRNIQLLLHNAGRLDPKVAMELRFLCACGRLLSRGPAPEDWQQRWEALPEHPDYRGGPLSRLRGLLTRLGWRGTLQQGWGDPAAAHAPGDHQGWKKAAQHSLVQEQWQKLAKRRRALQDAEEGVDAVASTSTYPEHTAHGKRLRLLQTDGVWSSQRAYDRHKRATDHCEHCGRTGGDLNHWLWECPALLSPPTEQHRELAAARRETGGRPVALWRNGLVPANYITGRRASPQMGWPDPIYLPDPDHPLRVYTDGSCIQTPLGPRAGWGVYFGPEHALNLGEPLAGGEQTAQRAEVRALVGALESTEGPLHVHSDSRYVVDTWAKLRQPTAGTPGGKHRDLWERVRRHLSREVRVTWVKRTSPGRKPSNGE
jgi:ribonuclease HI